MIDEPRRGRSVEEADEESEMLRRFAQNRDRQLRNQIVERYIGLATHIARQFRRPGIEEDVRQAAMIGLVKAVERFDPDYGVNFSSFAGVTIEGELKRYLRDQTWVVRVPRASKDLHLAVRRASDELAQRFGRSPGVDEIAGHLGVSREDVLRGVAATAAYDVGTIDHSADDHKAARAVAVATDETGFAHIADSDAVQRVLDRLPKREREIVRLRFFEGMSQSEIAEKLSMSQMHVSRLLRRSYQSMRLWLDDGDGASG